MIKPGQIQVKDTEVLSRLMSHGYHRALIRISEWIVEKFGAYFTEAWRPQRHPNDVHGTTPGRALDLRVRVYPDAQAVCDSINEHWLYDPDRPWRRCCIIHDSGKGWHMHVQCHDNTIYREV